MLQRMCEDMEYSQLLDIAHSKLTSIERILYISAFALSNYSSTVQRATKPFNPLLGETFEYVDPGKGYRYVSEQVSHHPPISACWCESANWNYWNEVNVKSKFWGKSMEIVPQGVCHVELKSSNGTIEHYTWKKVTTCANNIIVGNLWVDHYGEMRVINHTTGDVCVLNFKARGWTGANAFEISGSAFSGSGSVIGRDVMVGGDAVYALKGKWSDCLVATLLRSDDVTQKSILLWRMTPLPPNACQFFNQTLFALSLNDIHPSLLKLLPPTDSRLRPDQRLLEQGKWEEANEEKKRVEEGQRKRRGRGEREVVWFEKVMDRESGEEMWKWRGGYWERRGEWGDVEEIF